MIRARLIQVFLNAGIEEHRYERLNKPIAPYPAPYHASEEPEPDYEVSVDRESAIYQVTLSSNRIYILVPEEWAY